jgi:hypothetical protein
MKYKKDIERGLKILLKRKELNQHDYDEMVGNMYSRRRKK